MDVAPNFELSSLGTVNKGSTPKNPKAAEIGLLTMKSLEGGGQMESASGDTIDDVDDNMNSFNREMDGVLSPRRMLWAILRIVQFFGCGNPILMWDPGSHELLEDATSMTKNGKFDIHIFASMIGPKTPKRDIRGESRVRVKW